MNADSKLKVKSLLRRAGLVDTPKPVLACLCAVALVLIGFALWRFWPAGPASAGEDFSVDIQGEQLDDGVSGASGSAAAISVDVEGAVRDPGLYELPGDARAGDAIEAAGGMTKGAQRGAVNLAAPLEDGQQIVVPKKGGDTAGDRSACVDAGSSAKGASSSVPGKVDINAASAAELQQLAGIGESLSQRIIEYREANGPFGSVEELTKVPGIGDARLASIRSQICV